jgi:hypothetical protein
LVVTCSTANAKSSSGVEGRCFFTSRRRRRSVEGAAWGRGVGEVPRKFGWLVVYVWLNSMVYGRYNELVNENYNDYQWLIWLVVEPDPSGKWWTSSVGMMTFPIWWESHNPFHGSIIDLLYPIKMIERVNSINMIWNHLFHYVPLKTPWYPIKIPWFQSPTSQWMIEKTQPAEIGAVLWDSRLWLSEGAQMLANVDDASHMLLEHWHVQPDTQKQKHICIFPALFTSAQKSP